MCHAAVFSVQPLIRLRARVCSCCLLEGLTVACWPLAAPRRSHHAPWLPAACSFESMVSSLFDDAPMFGR